MAKGIDKLDIRLLNLVQQNNLLTAEEIAETIPLSPSAIARRLRTLRQSGAIAADVSVVAPSVAGQRISALLHIYLERHAPRAGLEALRRSLVESPEVQCCLEVSGLHDLVVLAMVADMEVFNAFVDEKLGENPAVRRYESSFVKKRLKMSSRIALSDAGATVR